VINPYAEQLRIPAQCFKPLRTQTHYLAFIETVTWYHQYQRTEQVDPATGEVFIETTLEDIERANELMKEVLLTKSDELPQGVRQFFEDLKRWLKDKQPKGRQATPDGSPPDGSPFDGPPVFYSKEVRAHFRMYPMKANRYLTTLMQYGYLKKSGGNRKSGYEYEVTDWGEYEQLKDRVNILDELLEALKKAERSPPPGRKARETGSITSV